MITKEKIGNELYVWLWERGLKKLLYKRWLNKGYGMVMDNQPFTAKDTEAFNQSIKPLTAHEIIDETVNYYEKNPRSINSNGDCCYLTENGNMCAVGRCLTDDSLKLAHERYEGKSAINLLRNELINFKPKYDGHLTEFWVDIQALHDFKSNWDNGKLSAKGLNYVNDLKSKYN